MMPTMSPEIAVPMMVFGLPVAIVFIVKYFKFREKQLEAASTPKQLAARSDIEAKQRELEARIENLESALIAMDSSEAPRLSAKKAAAALPAKQRPALPANRSEDEE